MAVVGVSVEVVALVMVGVAVEVVALVMVGVAVDIVVEVAAEVAVVVEVAVDVCPQEYNPIEGSPKTHWAESGWNG